MMKKAISLFLAVGLAFSAVPAGAQAYGPNTVWGAVPQGQEGVVNAVLLGPSGKILSMVPVVDGKFAFRDLGPGDYTVALYTSGGVQVVRACPVQLASGGTLEAVFTCAPAAAAPVAPKGGISTTAWVLMGAAAAGITAAIVIASDEDEGQASPAR
jgi:hypothetical protein